MHVGIAGEVRCVVTKADGKVKIDTGFQKNLILNQGLDFFGGGKGSSINASCAIGSGNSTPAVTQTKLDSFITLTSGADTTSDYSYVDKGDNLYRMWEQRKYRFTDLDNVNISELGLVSTGSTSENYYLTTRVLVKDSSGAPTSLSLKKGETLDIYYKIHKVVDTRDKAFVINMLDGNGASAPYNVIVKPALVGTSGWKVSESFSTSAYVGCSTKDLQSINSFPAEESRSSNWGGFAYISGTNKLDAQISFGLNSGNINGIRSLAVVGTALNFHQCQIRYGSVADDSPIPKTNKDTLTIPLEFSWGRYEGEL